MWCLFTGNNFFFESVCVCFFFFSVRFIVHQHPAEKEIFQRNLSAVSGSINILWCKACFDSMQHPPTFCPPCVSTCSSSSLQDKDISSHPREPCILWTSYPRMAWITIAAQLVTATPVRLARATARVSSCQVSCSKWCMSEVRGEMKMKKLDTFTLSLQCY